MADKYIHLKHRLKKRICKKNGTFSEYLDFQKLVIKVAKSGQTEAARLLRKVPRSYEADVFKNFDYDKGLHSCFVWSDTDEGHDYWSNVNCILREYERDNDEW